MPILTFPTSADGMTVDVLIGLTRANAQALRSAGRSVPQPILLRALVDSGSDFTSVVDTAVAPLGLLPLGPFTVNTANGMAIVNRYAVDFTLLAPGGISAQNLVQPLMPVLGMANAPIGFDVVVGMDLLRTCLLIQDGPSDQFTLAF
jgi:hypothetical protein